MLARGLASGSGCPKQPRIARPDNFCLVGRDSPSSPGRGHPLQHQSLEPSDGRRPPPMTRRRMPTSPSRALSAEVMGSGCLASGERGRAGRPTAVKLSQSFDPRLRGTSGNPMASPRASKLTPRRTRCESASEQTHPACAARCEVRERANSPPPRRTVRGPRASKLTPAPHPARCESASEQTLTPAPVAPLRHTARRPRRGR